MNNPTCPNCGTPAAFLGQSDTYVRPGEDATGFGAGTQEWQCPNCGNVFNASDPSQQSPAEDLRYNPDLDELFGQISGNPQRIAENAQRAARASAAMGGQAGAPTGGSPPKPPGGGASAAGGSGAGSAGGDPLGVEVDLTEGTIQKLSAAIGLAVARQAGNNAERSEQTVTGKAGSKHVWNSSLAQWQKVPQGSNQTTPPGRGQQAGTSWGGQIGNWLGTAIGSRYGGRWGSAIGGHVGQQAGQKIGGGVGAFADRAKDLALSPDSSRTLERMLPEATQSLIRWYKELDKATSRIMNHNFELGQQSAAMQNLASQREMTEAFRSQEIGNRLEPSARYLLENEQARKENEKGLTVLANAIDNYVQGFKEKVVGKLLQPLNGIAEGVNRLIGIGEGSLDRALTPWEMIKGMSEESERRAIAAGERARRLADESRPASGRLTR